MSVAGAITYSRVFFKAAERLSDAFRLAGAALRDKTLGEVILARDKEPPEGSRFRRGERINLYLPSGSFRRLKVCRALSGGFSNVYLVLDLDETTFYCLKENRALPVSEDEKNADLERESRILFAISPHPNIVAPISSHYLHGRFLILTEYVRGSDLNSEIADLSFNVCKALSYAVQICDALNHARTKLPRFLHGDIKPSNCLVDSLGLLKLTDFGQASWSREPRPDQGGTVGYMAPELHAGGTIDGSCDVYAFGVTLFEMLCGKRPFHATSKAEIVELHRTMPAPLQELETKEVHPDLIDLIGECLDKEPSRRPASFSEIRDRIANILQNEYDVAVPNPTIQPAPGQRACREGRAVGLYDDSAKLAASGDYQTASKAIDEALSEQPGNPLFLEHKAEILRKTGRTRAARRYLKASISLDPRRSDPYAAIAEIHLSTGTFERALSVAKRGLGISPDNGFLLAAAGKACFGLGDFKAAIDYLKLAVLDPKTGKTVFKAYVRACISVVRHAGVGAKREHLKVLMKVTRSGSQDLRARSIVALFAEDIDPTVFPWLVFCLDEAVIRFSMVLDPAERQKISKRLRSFAEHMGSHTYSSDILLAFARLLYEFGESSACCGVMMRLLDIHGPNAAAYYYLGVCAEADGDLQTALALYETSLRLNRGHEITRFAVRRVGAAVSALPQGIEPQITQLKLKRSQWLDQR